jgi:hypothetical protein
MKRRTRRVRVNKKKGGRKTRARRVHKGGQGSTNIPNNQNALVYNNPPGNYNIGDPDAVPQVFSQEQLELGEQLV